MEWISAYGEQFSRMCIRNLDRCNIYITTLGPEAHDHLHSFEPLHLVPVRQPKRSRVSDRAKIIMQAFPENINDLRFESLPPFQHKFDLG